MNVWEFTYLDENNEKQTIRAKFTDQEIAQMKKDNPKVNWEA